MTFSLVARCEETGMCGTAVASSSPAVAARCSYTRSGVGVLDFMKRSSLVEIDFEGFNRNKENVIKMAEVEQLDGHKLSVKIRQKVK